MAFSFSAVRSARRSAAQSQHEYTMTTVVAAAVLVFACVLMSYVHEVDAQGTTHGRSLLQDEANNDVACDDKCQKWVRFPLSLSLS